MTPLYREIPALDLVAAMPTFTSSAAWGAETAVLEQVHTIRVNEVSVDLDPAFLEERYEIFRRTA